MMPRVFHVLQKLADLDTKSYERVAEELMKEFAIPQPSIAKSLKALSPPPLVPTAVKRGRPPGKKPTAAKTPGEGSKAGAVRALLETEGPKTTAEIAQRIGVPATHIHPLLASIGAKAVGTVTDPDGDERKAYGFESALVRDESVSTQQ